MKCAHCGNELNGAIVCSKCGRKAAAPGRDIEVEYKEFRVSEFLEIKKSQQASRAETADKSGAEQKGTPFSLKPRAGMKEKPAPEKGKKGLFLLLLLILILVGLIAGAYYFLRFFL